MKRTSAGERPAILGDGREPAGRVPVSQPTLPDFETYASELRGIFETAQITNARWVETLERRAAEYLGVREVIAMANATSGLVLSIKVLGLRGTVALPSFTFPATLHALLWNGLRPRLLDCDPETFNLSLDDLERVLAGESLSAVHLREQPGLGSVDAAPAGARPPRVLRRRSRPGDAVGRSDGRELRGRRDLQPRPDQGDRGGRGRAPGNQ
jgi:hypothetical protein